MNHTYISLDYLFSQLINIPTELKLKAFLELSWVVFFDEEKNFIKSPSARICWFGWAWFTYHEWEVKIWDSNLTVDWFIKEAKKMRAYWWYMSYLNSSNKTTNEMIDILDRHGHFSTQHMIFINILISWISTSVENEFNSQRDIIHLSRITEARTKIQNDPPYVVLNEKLLPLYATIKNAIKNETKWSDFTINNSDDLEALNLIHSSAKGTAIILSWSVKNFKKLTSMKNDNWKEIEFRRSLEMIDNLVSLF